MTDECVLSTPGRHTPVAAIWQGKLQSFAFMNIGARTTCLARLTNKLPGCPVVERFRLKEITNRLAVVALEKIDPRRNF